MDDAVLLEHPLPPGWVRVMDAGEDEAAALSAVPVVLEVADLLALTEQTLANGDALPPEGAQPRYVEGDTPWQPKEPANETPQ